MVKKILDPTKILLVICSKDKAEAKQQLELFAGSNLVLPPGVTLSVHTIVGRQNFAVALNEVQKNFNAKYKIYLTSPVGHVDPNFLVEVCDSFGLYPKTGMTGLFGSELPFSGDYVRSEVFYGAYHYFENGKDVRSYFGKTPLLNKTVHILESSFFATNVDIAWDENVGEDFLLISQCCKYRNAGYQVTVTNEKSRLWLIFAEDNCSYKPKANQQNYQNQLEQFRLLYRKKMMPLVSILIPTYNQPKYCMAALESALNQTYPNIEILVGDDSTNEDTKNAIKPYLRKYKNIQYFYHDGKIPRGGTSNSLFLLNHCNGEYINYLLHDDLFYPEKISKMMNYYVKDLDDRISLITSARDAIDPEGRKIARQNPWQPREDTILRGDEVGRILLFTVGNFIGELTTVLVKKRDLLVKNSKGEKIFAAGNFCGITSRIYGDLDTWYNLLKDGGYMIFIAESLSAFRHHPDQNTHKPLTKASLPVDAINFVTIAWLNNCFLRNEEEYVYCCNKWLYYLQLFAANFEESDTEEIKVLKSAMYKLRDSIATGKYEIVFNAAVDFLLFFLPEENPVLKLVKKNEKTDLWEKVNDGIFEYLPQKAKVSEN